jgi:hypothetical protein
MESDWTMAVQCHPPCSGETKILFARINPAGGEFSFQLEAGKVYGVITPWRSAKSQGIVWGDLENSQFNYWT